MIEYVIAAEFDIVTGAVIRAIYPPLEALKNESTLAAYMIPDGAHKRQRDVTYFKFDMTVPALSEGLEDMRIEFNARQTIVQYFMLEKNWAQAADSKGKKLDFYITLFEDTVHLKPLTDDQLLDFKISKIDEHKVIFEGFLSIKVGDKTIGLRFSDAKNLNLLTTYIDSLKSGMQAEEKEVTITKKFYFHNEMNQKKDSHLQRGALIRSIAVCSSVMNVFYKMEDLISGYADEFMNMPVELESKSLVLLNQILKSAIQTMNSKLRFVPSTRVFVSPDEMNYMSINNIGKEGNSKTLSACLDFSISNSSLIKFITIFQERTMTIYNAILRGAKILFVSNEASCQEISECVSACVHLVSPLNVLGKILPFTHLLDIGFLETESYITGVSNPLFRTRKNWWEVCCDVTDGSVIDMGFSIQNKNLENFGEIRLINIDLEFIRDIMKKIREKEVTEYQVRKFFYDYTKNFIDYSINSSNILDLPREDKQLLEAFDNRSNRWKKTYTFEMYQKNLNRNREMLKVAFADKYLDVNTALINFCDKKILNDFDLLKDYSVLTQCLNDSFRQEIFLKLLLSKKSDLSVLASGMLSSNKEIQQRTAQLFSLFEENPNSKSILSFFSYYTLFIYENLKFSFANEADVEDG